MRTKTVKHSYGTRAPPHQKKLSGEVTKKAALFPDSHPLREMAKTLCSCMEQLNTYRKNRGPLRLLTLTFQLCSPPPHLFPAQSQGQGWHWQKACVSFHLTVTLASASIISRALEQPLLKAADLYLHCAGLAMNLTAPEQQQQAWASPSAGGRQGAGSWEGREPEEKRQKQTPKG